MTVTYTAEVATCSGFGCFLKLLIRWRGSIYKLVWLDLTCFLLMYYIVNITYRHILNEDQKVVFVSIVKYCYEYSNLIPLSFVLGFYVSIVMTRWWNQYTSIPWPDPIAVYVSTHVHGQDERGRVMRRTIMRYVCLCLTMVLINVAPRVKKRFPTLTHLIDAGLLNENEMAIMTNLNVKFPRHSKHWLPIVWAASIVTRARKEGRIRDDFAVKTVIDELNKFRGQCGLLISYDTISVPLVYTQVVTLAVYSYFVTAVLGQQWYEGKTVGGEATRVDMYFPIFTTLQFFFYMGWLKVAEQLINPFGEDDDDFEVNWMVDRNLQVSYLIVDEMHHEHPELLKDQYWDEIFPMELPHTVASMKTREEPPEASTANIDVTKNQAEVIPVVPSSVRVDDMVGKKLYATNYKFDDVDSLNDDGSYEMHDIEDSGSGIQFTARKSRESRERPQSGASQASLGTLTGTMTRVNTVASALKRFLSRDNDSRPESAVPDSLPTRMPGSASSASIAPKWPGQGSMKITDQVIEEVDEQMTITSMANNKPDVRPTAESIFQSVPRSAPMDVPQSSLGGTPGYYRTHSALAHNDRSMLFPDGGVDALLSASAPVGDNMMSKMHAGMQPIDLDRNKSASRDNDRQSLTSEEPDVADMTEPPPPDDDFERLRQEREKERQERHKQKVARTISNQPVMVGGTMGSVLDTELLMEQLTNAEAEMEDKESRRYSTERSESNL